MELEFPIHHVIVVGFHHKKGCQIEFAYPAFDMDIEKTAWKHLPTLAMPDGAHNFATDTVYFHLPSLKKAGETVFGVACFQQIDAEVGGVNQVTRLTLSGKVKNKGEEVTRSTIQKSVAVLSKYPLYGHIQVKMSLITGAYFREGDFGQVSILEEAYHNLNACLTPDLLSTPEAFVGLSSRDLITTFRHEVLILLKLLLLEKRILFRGSSVGPLCSALLTLVSLLPLSLEYGLGQSASVKTSKTMSIVPQFSLSPTSPTPNNLSFDELLTAAATEAKGCDSDEKMDPEKPSPVQEDGGTTPNQMEPEFHVSEPKEKRRKDLINSSLITGSVASRAGLDATDNVRRSQVHDKGQSGVGVEVGDEMMILDLKSPVDSEGGGGSESGFSTSSTEKGAADIPDFLTAVQLTPEDAGLPLAIFTKGYLCHPYLSLHYMDLLSDSGVRGFLVGATNILFKQKRDLVDVIVEMSDGGSVEISDPTLKRLVTLTTEDLRFAENIVRNVQNAGGERIGGVGGDNFLDGVGWEGGDEWIRAQFKYYLMCLMRTSQVEEGSVSLVGGRCRESFGSGFVTAWQSTHSWRVWNDYVNSEERETPGIYLLSPGHPCSGQISVADMKLRISHSMQRTEGGRKFNQAVGKAVASTGKVMGGALTSAKGALSSWWTSVLTAPPATGVEIGSEDANANNTTTTMEQGEHEANNPASTTGAAEEPKRQSVWFTS